MISFILNNELVQTSLPTGTVLLDFIRKNQRLTGTKEGCREGDCGSCTVLIGELVNNEIRYKTAVSCLFPLKDAHLKHVVTIEGLNSDNLNFLQEKFVELGGTQCGFCTPGFIVSATGYFLSRANYDVNSAIEYIAGNICRCTGYSGIKRALLRTIDFLNLSIEKNISQKKDILSELIRLRFIPEYFLTIPKRLKSLGVVEEKIIEETEPKVYVSGGTDLYVQDWEELIEKDIDLISTRKGFKGIEKKNNEIIIGGATTISEIEESDLIKSILPELSFYLKYFGSKQIRNRATIAGNIVNASPIGDLANILLTLNAKINLVDKSNKRTIRLREFYLGYKKLNKTSNELVQSITFTIPNKNYFFNFEKVSRRTYLDIASVNTSFFAFVKNEFFEEVSITAGGVAPIPLYLEKASTYLSNKKVSAEILDHAIEIALKEISPINDARGSAEYKSLLLRQLLFAHFEKLFPDLISKELVLGQGEKRL